MSSLRARGSLAVSCLLLATAALAQEWPGWTPISKEKEETAVAMMKAMTPGEPHRRLATLAGEWTFTSRVWLEAGAPPSEGTGSATSTMVLGGRYLQSAYRGDLVGVAFEGFGLLGYDNTTEQYQAVWLDNMSTTLMFLTGAFDDASRTLTLRTALNDLVKPATKVPVREVLTIADADTHTRKVFETRDGRETLKLEIRYTRKR